jgi:DNA-binding winged helix-turn-helix (wHTH) protein/tetratricopeptide (TPR) repeat protein
VWRGDKTLALTPKAFSLLTYLAAHPGRLITKDELLDAVWPDTHVADAVLKVCVREIRQRLGDRVNQPRYIETVHRRGYRFIAEVRENDQGAFELTPSEAMETEEIRSFVGRKAEVDQLGRALRDALNGRRRVVFVTGEPGIGKTSVVEAFLRRAAGNWNLAIARGQCLEHYGAGEAYAPLFEALSRLCHERPNDKFVRLLRTRAPTWFVQMPWLAITQDREALQREIVGATRERMLREIVEAIEALSAETAVVLVIEDLQWSDPSTLDFVSLLARRSDRARLLLIGTYRPVDAIVEGHPVKSLKQELQQHRHGEELPLEFLRAAHVEEYLAARFGGPVPEGLAALIHRRTNGNPLFMVNIVDDLLARRLLVETANGWELRAALSDLEDSVPEGLREMIERQIERLPEQDSRLLEAASVLGNGFSAAALAATLEQDIVEVDTRCQRLAQRGQFLRSGMAEGTGVPTGVYQFIHALYQNVLYRRLPSAKRVLLHRCFGEWLEKEQGKPAELAHHFFQAAPSGESGRAVAHAVAAAERAVSLLAWEEAISHYEAALRTLQSERTQDDEQKCRVIVALGESQMRAARHTAARETFQRTAVIARRLGIGELFARSVLGLGAAHQAIGTSDPSLVGLLEEALQVIGEADRSLRAMVLARLAYALYSVPNFEERRKVLCEEAVRLARQSADPETLVWVLLYTRWALWGPHNLRERLAGSTELVQIAEKINDRGRRAMAHASHLIDALEAGDIETVDTEIARFARWADDSRQPWFVWSVMRFQCMRALLDGRFADAERLASEGLGVGQRLDHPDVMNLYGAQMAILRFQQGRSAELEPIVRTFVVQHPSIPSWRCMLAYIYSEESNEQEARRHFEWLAATGFAELRRDNLWLAGMTFLAEACVFLRDIERAQILYEMLQPYAEHCVVISFGVSCLGSVSRPLGLLAGLTSRWKEAARHFRHAMEVHARMGARPWVALTQYDYARTLLQGPKGSSAKAHALLRQSLATANALGMDRLARKVALLTSSAGPSASV